MTIFWSVIALFYFVLAIVTCIALYRLRQDLSTLDHMSPSGIFNKAGRVVSVESTLYKALQSILLAEIIGFILAAIAATIPAIFASG